MTSTLILGASDPEMACIEELASSAGWRVLHAAALGRNGVLGRVFGGGAYQATAVLDSGTGEVVPCPDAPVVLVECGGPALDSADVVARCDHHNPGDPGYGRPPTEFLPASSLGQAIRLLALSGEIPADWRRLDASGWIEAPRPGDVAVYGAGILAVRAPEGVAAAIPLRILLTAAGDHCLGAAYAGQCPGVDPAALIAHRRDGKAAWLASLPTSHPARREVEACAPGRPLREAVDAACARTAAALRDAPSLVLVERGGHCGDPSRCGCGPDSYGSGSPNASTLWGSGDCYCDIPGCCVEQPIVEVRDARALCTLPLLPDVASEMGHAVLYRMPPSPAAKDQRVKVGLTGAGEGSVPGREPVEAFLGGWARDQGLEGLYGDPSRGFAGGYEPAGSPSPE